MKSFKPYVRKICMEENGHVVMMAVFDTVDDTVLVKKTLLTVSHTTKIKSLCIYIYILHRATPCIIVMDEGGSTFSQHYILWVNGTGFHFSQYITGPDGTVFHTPSLLYHPYLVFISSLLYRRWQVVWWS